MRLHDDEFVEWRGRKVGDPWEHVMMCIVWIGAHSRGRSDEDCVAANDAEDKEFSDKLQ